VHVVGIDWEEFWGHLGIEADGSMLSVDGADVPGYRLREDVDGILGAGVQLVIVAFVLRDETADLDSVLVLMNVELECWGDRCHGC
jgi:hypothetical protein